MNGSSASRAPDASLATFLALKPRLLGIAYRMLGTRVDSEDVIQEAYERWHVVSARQPVEDPSALLVTLTTRLCIDRYRRERTRREAYTGPWLPEPVPTRVDDPLEHLESERLLSIGLLRVMECLSPLERSAFILADAFDYRAREIAPVIGCSEVHCRQLLHRARKALKALSALPEASCGGAATYREGLSRLQKLLDAVRQGNVDEAERMLAADVAMYSDGGGNVAAVRRPVRGPRAVARLLVGLARQQTVARARRYAYTPINGSPALIVYHELEVESVLVVEYIGGRVRGAYVQRNPDKLTRLCTRLTASA
jgi:RNA polymerase sigma-70 factor, ECF subfamily